MEMFQDFMPRRFRVVSSCASLTLLYISTFTDKKSFYLMFLFWVLFFFWSDKDEGKVLETVCFFHFGHCKGEVNIRFLDS